MLMNLKVEGTLKGKEGSIKEKASQVEDGGRNIETLLDNIFALDEDVLWLAVYISSTRK